MERSKGAPQKISRDDLIIGLADLPPESLLSEAVAENKNNHMTYYLFMSIMYIC